MTIKAPQNKIRILITGGGGYTGSQLTKKILEKKEYAVLATDIKFAGNPGAEKRVIADIRDADSVLDMFRKFKPHAVVHLASIVTPGKKSSREFEYEVDVVGTQNVLAACQKNNVGRLIVTSSGAAYGYHADNPIPLKETDAIRGNYEFAYSHHKRLVEEMLAKHTITGKKPDLVIFRVGTILGENTNNQITALFRKNFLPGIRKSESPFVFIWDQDVLGAIIYALVARKKAGKIQFIAPSGIYNLAGDGWLSIQTIGKRLAKPVIKLPATFLKILFSILKPLKLSRYGPEQIRFLQYRPVLDNTKLKSEFGYTPAKTSAQVFDFYCQANSLGKKQ